MTKLEMEATRGHQQKDKTMKKIELTEAQVLERLRGLVTRERKQCVIAAELGVSDTYVCNVLAGRRKPSPEFLALIGVTKRTVYEGAG